MNIYFRIVIKFLICLAVLYRPVSIFCQNNVIKGKVIDSKTKEPLAFVNILINKTKVITTDIDGKFRVRQDGGIDSFKISYIGYKPMVYHLSRNESTILIKLERSEIALPEVVIRPGVNPALHIIKAAIKNRDINNPERLKAFTYTSYNKMIFNASIDTMKIRNTHNLDSNDIKFLKLFRKMYLFIMESVTEHKYLYPQKHSEKVIATKTSGLKQPVFVMLASQFQSFSFYGDYVMVADKPYLNPVTSGSDNKYDFVLKDTLYKDKDTVFIISFQPMKNKNFDGIKGLLYINSNRYAIQNVIAEPAEQDKDMRIKIQQEYEFIDNSQWFPVQLNTDIVFKNIKVDTSCIVAHGNTYLQDIDINPAVKPKRAGSTTFEVMPDAADKSEAYWNAQRKDSLNKKEMKTYHIIDSIGNAHHFDRIAKTIETLLLGRIPYKFVDLEIGRFINYSDYQGFLLGIGLQTNSRFSRNLSIGGYYSYAFKIDKPVYGGNIQYLLDRNSNFKLHLSYNNDYEETGGHKFFDDNEILLNPENFKNMLILHKDKIEKKQIAFTFRTLQFCSAYLGLSQTKKYITDTSLYPASSLQPPSSVDFTELTAGVKFAYNEHFIKTPNYTLSLGTNYPTLWLQYKRGFNNLLDGNFIYNQFDLKLKKSFKIKNVGKSTFELLSGYIDKNLPLTNLYNGMGTYRNFTIDAPFSFATMRFNEFFSDKYISLFYTHSFGNLLIKRKHFKPEPVIVNNIIFGSMTNKQEYVNAELKTLAQGYYESGLLINNILNMKYYTLGFGCYYRYGPYSFNKNSDNFAFKATLVFPFNQ